ncbi:MAG: hypothetical protein ABR936_14335 [Bacteroidota bacterium]|jgi:hypothetical protein
MRKLSFVLLLFGILIAEVVKAQDNNTVSPETRELIQNQLDLAYGTRYELGIAVSVDSLKNQDATPDRIFEDTFGTLQHCIIFTAKSKNIMLQHAGLIGIFKGNGILWKSDTIINTDIVSDNEIVSTQDLNKDGQIDIITSWIDPQSYGSSTEQLWIVSWDGQTGNFINTYEEGISSLESIEGGFQLVDFNGDGIKEILGKWVDNPQSETTVNVTYSWNGQKYGKWSNPPQPIPGAIAPRDKIIVVSHSLVYRSQDFYKYSFNFENNIESIQQINNIRIICHTDSVFNIISRLKWESYFKRNSFIDWSNLFTHPNFIRQGERESIFSFSSIALPSIMKCFIRGYNGTSSKGDLSTNSFQTQVIGPADPLNPFVPLNFLDTLTNYTNQSRSLGWIINQTTANKYLGYFASAKTKLIQHDSVGARTVLLQVLHDVDIDSTASLSSEAYALLRFNTEYLANLLPQSQVQTAPFFAVKLVSSNNTKLTGGTLQYYEGSWKDAVNNNDGTFNVSTTAKTISLRMTYEYGTQTKSNVSISNDTIVFQTVNAQIQLQNSSGILIDTGTVQYYAGAWRTLGTTINGTATKELLPANYSFRMTYAYASKDKQQDISTNATVVFQTVNAAVQLQNSQGTLIDQGTVQYYSGAWRDFGTTVTGVTSKELLPNSYSFRMTYAFASKDKQQDLSTNATVIFQTVNAIVQLQNSQGTLINQGTVQYYSGAWRDLGTTINGVANKELLPNSYSFRMTYAFASKDKQQDISTNATVIFQTVNAIVQLQNSQGSLIDQGTVQYYSGAWRDLGTTTNGVANKELLSNNYSFRMSYAYASKDKQQDISTNSTVVFQTVNATVQLQNSQGSLIDQGTVQYYSGVWRDFGTTTNGIVTKDLLPNTYSFRMTYEYVSLDKTQDLSTNNIVSFSTVLCTIRVKNSQNQLVDNALASYYSGAWRQIGNTVNGVITKELLPVNLSFRVKFGTQQQDKQQNISTNNLVEFAIP